ncbi:hypothetical protein KR51_00001310 [Rubidibacter lacunae KORDI 51-2]|uniref:Uncharacterized protein n=1 Tax=Rubidibacter lacunae KORDI 51-2 TaxID=582515 RepID=U5DN28_9CHRO|nr:hypothetical protein [Rubidibacter lacunae]ERN43071.1 hypothetical protein KR51_00001310 [Rubidibacter lacunae KORDI 51-2]
MHDSEEEEPYATLKRILGLIYLSTASINRVYSDLLMSAPKIDNISEERALREVGLMGQKSLWDWEQPQAKLETEAHARAAQQAHFLGQLPHNPEPKLRE